MKYRLPSFSLSGFRGTKRDSLQKNYLPTPSSDWKDSEFFRSWMVYEFDLEGSRSSGRINWNALLGLSLAFSIGAGFWTATGLLIAYLW